MSQKSKWEYFKAIYQRYRKATLSSIILGTNSGDTILNVRARIIVPKSGDPILTSRSYFYGSGRLSRTEITNMSPEFPMTLTPKQKEMQK